MVIVFLLLACIGGKMFHYFYTPVCEALKPNGHLEFGTLQTFWLHLAVAVFLAFLFGGAVHRISLVNGKAEYYAAALLGWSAAEALSPFIGG